MPNFCRFCILANLKMKLYSEKMIISTRCIHGFMSNLIKKSSTDSKAKNVTSIFYYLLSLLLLYNIWNITLIRQPKCFCTSGFPWPILIPPWIQQWSSKTDWNFSSSLPGSHSIGSPMYWLAPLRIEKLIET